MDQLRLIEILQAIVGKLPNDPERPDEGVNALKRELQDKHAETVQARRDAEFRRYDI